MCVFVCSYPFCPMLLDAPILSSWSPHFTKCFHLCVCVHACVRVCVGGWWYDQALERDMWRSVCSQRVEPPSQPEKNVICHVCSRSFRRECDKAHHKCTVERSKPIQDQGAMAVHRCREDESATSGPVVEWQLPIVCGVCGRQFSRTGDMKRHKCSEPQPDVVQCPICNHWFKNTRSLAVHQRAKHQV